MHFVLLQTSFFLENSYRKQKYSQHFSGVFWRDYGGIKHRIWSHFWLKSIKFARLSKNINQETLVKPIDKPPLSLKVKLLSLFLTFTTFFSKIDNIYVKKK